MSQWGAYANRIITNLLTARLSITYYR